jgi:mannitol/fructose-specific phosphotransferase system IIA component (Ntr-type)
MNFEAELRNGCFCAHLKSDTKEGVIAEMVDALVAQGRLQDREAAIRAVMARECTMSTGMQHGVALPHGKTAAVGKMVTVLALKKEGLDFGALDGQPSRIFVMTISPVNVTGPHLQYLGAISRILSCPAVRDQLMTAANAEEIIRALTE